MKKSFLIYLDNYPTLSQLTMEQRGLLLTVLFTYADRICRGEDVTMEEVADGFPNLHSQTRIACEFMGGNILRDTTRWQQRCQARQDRREGLSQGRQAAASPTDAPDLKFLEDTERTRRLVERIRLEG